MSQYPEHDKMRAIIGESQAIGEFLENSGFVLAEYRCPHGFPDDDTCDENTPDREWDCEGTKTLWPVAGSITDILANYFGIDQEKIEQEKRQMLEEFRRRGPNPRSRQG